jgi:hypothetical protein
MCITNLTRFGMFRTYEGVPTYVPSSEQDIRLRYKANFSTTLLKELKDVHSIIMPYPNLSSWLYNYHFFMHSNTVSKNRHSALLRIQQHPEYDPTSIDEADVL